MSEVGHNSMGDRVLLSIVTRIEKLEEERKALGDDIKEIYQEAKSGYDCKVVRRLIRERAMDPAKLEEQEATLERYRRDLGAYVTTPLGMAAIERVGSRA